MARKKKVTRKEIIIDSVIALILIIIVITPYIQIAQITEEIEEMRKDIMHLQEVYVLTE